MVDMMKLMRQAQSMQKNMAKMQAELAERTFEFSVGGGMVKAVAKGDNTIQSITIDPKAADPSDVDMLQDTVLAAVNGALKLARDAASDEMAKVTGGMGMGGLPGFG